MKIIDLLNKMANGEEPLNIRYEGVDYKYNRIDKNYQRKDGYLLFGNISTHRRLNDEIEIIEEPKKIEKLKNFPDVASWGKDYGLTSALEEQAEYNEILFYKLNELIRKVNEMDNN